jgi:SAM-dependent methyltransferase
MTSPLAAAWDHHADVYARLFAPLTTFVAHSLVSTAAARVAPGGRWLDVACGAGAATLPALAEVRRQGAGQVVACDFSPRMVELTQRAAGPEVACEVQDGQALTYPDASFDAVVSNFGLFLFEDRAAGWREAARVLRPGGLLATSVWKGPADNPMLRLQTEPVFRALPERLKAPPARSWLEISTAEGLLAEVLGTGAFVGAEVYPLRAELLVGRWPELWEAMRDNPVMGALLRRCTPEELAAVQASVLDHFQALAGGPEQPLRLEAVCNLLFARRAP